MILTVILGGVCLFLALWLLLLTWREEVEHLACAESGDCAQRKSNYALQPPELAIRIFSLEDRDFIFLTRSARIKRIYLQERRRVALHWVRRTSSEVSKIMRKHRLNSRQSHNLNVATEAKLFFQYLKLQFLCGLLVFLIKILGPHALKDLATYASDLYQLIAEALPGSAAQNHVSSAQHSVIP